MNKNIHVMAKPTGAQCNIDCKYCFYLEKEKLYPDSLSRMSKDTLELYVKQYIEAQGSGIVNFTWQGGEPMLMGIDFYKQAIAYQKKYAGKKMVTNSLQTNAVGLDDEWASFLTQEQFLVGVSIDGTEEMHDHYRVDKGGKPTWDKVMRGIESLKTYGTEFNTLTVINDFNVKYPEELYYFLTRKLGSKYLQFIPIVERIGHDLRDTDLALVEPKFGSNATVTDWSVNAKDYGEFLCTIFDQWYETDISHFFVQFFDVILAGYLNERPTLCDFAKTCGDAMVIEHNGDLYSCDHFVYPGYNLGNIKEKTIKDMSNSTEQRKFGNDKRDTLTQYCKDCEFLFTCNGGCPKQRFIDTPTGEGGLNYFCESYKMFFNHTDKRMKYMANELKK